MVMHDEFYMAWLIKLIRLINSLQGTDKPEIRRELELQIIPALTESDWNQLMYRQENGRHKIQCNYSKWKAEDSKVMMVAIADMKR